MYPKSISFYNLPTTLMMLCSSIHQGQQSVKTKLISSSTENRVSHALLFFGQPGSGVLPMARAFAQFLNCENPQAEDSCGICGSCRRATKMEHPDIHFVYPIVKRCGN
ncbi:MAG: hypothetical protein IPK10_10645 [Bacteroidetes bacterium]|nr:hypothetical protein [Bacteroidota bacterium]